MFFVLKVNIHGFCFQPNIHLPADWWEQWDSALAVSLQHQPQVQSECIQAQASWPSHGCPLFHAGWVLPSLQHLASIPQCGNNLGGVAFNLGGALNLTREKTKKLWDPAGESIGCHSGGSHSNQAKVLLAVLYHCEGQDGCATEVVFASAVDGPILDDTCVAENWRFLPKYQYSTYIDKHKSMPTTMFYFIEIFHTTASTTSTTSHTTTSHTCSTSQSSELVQNFTTTTATVFDSARGSWPKHRGRLQESPVTARQVKNCIDNLESCCLDTSFLPMTMSKNCLLKFQSSRHLGSQACSLSTF